MCSCLWIFASFIEVSNLTPWSIVDFWIKLHWELVIRLLDSMNRTKPIFCWPYTRWFCRGSVLEFLDFSYFCLVCIWGWEFLFSMIWGIYHLSKYHWFWLKGSLIFFWVDVEGIHNGLLCDFLIASVSLSKG